jgi:hypothetical protein
MPLSYAIDQSRGLIHEVWTGDVTARQLKALWKAYLSNPQVLAIRKTLVDMRNGNIAMRGMEMMDLIEKVAIPGLKGLDWKTALVVADRTQFGFSRQFQVYSHYYNRNSIFEDYDEALRWILAQ